MTQIANAADQTNNDTVLADLLADLGDDTVLETIGEEGVAALSEQLVEVLDETIVGEIGDIAAAAPADVIVADELVADVIAEAAPDAVVNVVAQDVLDDLLDEVADAVHADDARKQVYAEQGENMKVVADGTPPETTPESVEKAKGKKKGGKKKTSVPAGYGSDAEEGKAADAAPEADAAPAEPKAPKVPRATLVTHKPGDLLLIQLGAAAPDLLVFDLAHTPEQMEEARNAFVARMNLRDGDGAIADKVRLKIMMLMNWLHKGGELNEVLKRTFNVLHREGKLTSGDKGNLQTDLLAKPYSIGTARSQANQMFMAFPVLGLTKKEKGVMVANDNSPLLAMINAKLGLQ
jgi:hypothetical protein